MYCPLKNGNEVHNVSEDVKKDHSWQMEIVLQYIFSTNNIINCLHQIHQYSNLSKQRRIDSSVICMVINFFFIKFVICNIKYKI